MKIKVSLIIATYKRHDILGTTLAVAMSQDYANLEIIVVDQTPIPFAPSADLRREPSISFNYYWTPKPNLPAARNYGIRHSTGEVLIFIDDDVLIEQDFVTRMIATYTSDEIGGVCGVSVPKNFSDLCAESIRMAHFLGVDGPLLQAASIPVRSMNGVNMSFRRTIFAKAGFFDEAFAGSGWGEDVEFTIRVRKLGYRLLLNSTIPVVHLQPLTGGCSNRDVAVGERIRRERLVLRLYIVLKHAGYAPLSTLRELVAIYRQHALNKSLLQSGLRLTMRRNWEITFAARNVISYLFGRRIALLDVNS